MTTSGQREKHSISSHTGIIDNPRCPKCIVCRYKSCLQFWKDSCKTLKHTTQNTFFIRHHQLHMSNIYFPSKMHTAKKKSTRVIGIYTIAIDTSPHSLLSLQAWIPTGRTVLLQTSPTTEPSRAISHHWRGAGTRKGTQTQWPVPLALRLL